MRPLGRTSRVDVRPRSAADSQSALGCVLLAERFVRSHSFLQTLTFLPSFLPSVLYLQNIGGLITER